eukprot:1136674-Pelagomonas_calceolata.AAC.3
MDQNCEETGEDAMDWRCEKTGGVASDAALHAQNVNGGMPWPSRIHAPLHKPGTKAEKRVEARICGICTDEQRNVITHSHIEPYTVEVHGIGMQPEGMPEIHARNVHVTLQCISSAHYDPAQEEECGLQIDGIQERLKAALANPVPSPQQSQQAAANQHFLGSESENQELLMRCVLHPCGTDEVLAAIQWD